MAVSKRLRFEILRRDNHTCRYCGQGAPVVALTVDHVTPLALGGTDDPANLVAACADCNAGKSSTTPDAATVNAVEEHTMEWRTALELAAEQERAERYAQDADLDAFAHEWKSYKYGFNDRYTVDLPGDWRPTVQGHLNRGLTMDDLFYAIRTAMLNRNLPAAATFAYYCGVCRNLIRKHEGSAEQIIQETRTV